MSVKIIVDSACDITQEKAKEMNIDVLPLKTMFGDEEFLDGVTLNHQEFFPAVTRAPAWRRQIMRIASPL